MNKNKTFNIILISLFIIILVLLNIRQSGIIDEQNAEDDDYTLNDTAPDEEEVGSYGVTSDSTIATEVGMKVLEQGGNAVDAAIAVSFVLGVGEPYGSGIGGGGTMLIHPEKGSDESPVIYDYREVAPESEELPDSGTGVPGFVQGMYDVHDDFGTVEMEQLIEPSINFASNGVTVSETLHNRLNDAEYRMPDLDHMYPDGEPIEAGEILKQQQLADTLTAIKEEGPDAFYTGKLAEQITDQEDKISEEDLESYEVEVSEPIEGQFGDYDVLAPPPPSGGIMLLQSLEMAEMLQIEDTKDKPVDFAMMMGMINRVSYKDRLEKVGDPSFTEVPTNEMLSDDHIKDLASNIEGSELSDEYRSNLDSDADLEDHENTTHFVVVDKDGMMVSVTNTLSNFFGSGEYVEGFFLNNQLKNFSNSENSPNKPEPGKRPFSYTTPAVLAKNGNPVIGIGASGGRRITPIISQQLVRTVKFNEPIQAAVEEPRTFLELDEDKLQVENDYVFLEDPEENLDINVEYSDRTSYFGSVQGLVIDYENDNIHGASDPRRQGSWESE
ncbi:gamma-glutamyltranspeptidase [Halobacillus andaensis]|uniref:Glutathione hydrolase proenzyme n=1 Tax=Halobacillus andaensis TaxID=1176239 RepID=A0A917EVU5_HALAA|nr:gamma-glutamyltransferase [Halobacillus andaensis]MBP2004366.1 gamma-glutamyltranspeptidase/glutathione hydrolase [Halobacillus andaensis]GGF22193.1 gamma-glutamyltranspeptidase [Halobacillus andaensis]